MEKLKNKAKVNKIIKFSNVDGPGNRMSIFFQGCNYNCVYCHNPETINMCNHCQKCVEVCPVEALYLSEKISKSENQKVLWDKKKCVECDRCTEICPTNSSPKTTEYTVEELLKEIKKVKGFIRGITVSGGEATLNYKFVTELFIEVKKLGLTTFVDTNGSLDLSDEKYREFVGVTDKFMLDVKVWDNQNHLDYINSINKKNNDTVKKNIEFLGRRNENNEIKLYEVRTVVVPKLFDNIETIENTSKLVGILNEENQTNIFDKVEKEGEREKVEEIKYKIIKYRKIGVRKETIEKELENINSPTNEIMEELKEIAIKNNVKDIILI